LWTNNSMCKLSLPTLLLKQVPARHPTLWWTPRKLTLRWTTTCCHETHSTNSTGSWRKFQVLHS
jgi:hypothetical protein